MQKIKQALNSGEWCICVREKVSEIHPEYYRQSYTLEADKQVVKALQELSEIKELLKSIEFVSSGEPYIPCCPDCGVKEGSNHKPDCQLAKLIKECI